MRVKLICPNSKCQNHQPGKGRWYQKIGYYKPKHNNQPIPRYKCKTCGKSFSTATLKNTTYNQKKPEINKQLFLLLVSGVSLRRSAKILGVRYDTVVAHFRYLAKKAREAHYEHLKTVKTSFVMIDELETFLHARAKALSVPMVVRIKTGEILGFNVGKKLANGKLAFTSRSKYGWTVNDCSLKFHSMLTRMKYCIQPDATFKCDGKNAYPQWVNGVLPEASMYQINSTSSITGNGFDELFAINNMFAKMRHDMNRLGRKTWSTTKSIEGLKNHIWLYVAWNNKYEIG